MREAARLETRRIGQPRQQRPRRRDHHSRRAAREGVQRARAGGRDLEVRRQAAVRIDFLRRKRQHAATRRRPLTDRAGCQERSGHRRSAARRRRRSARRGTSSRLARAIAVCSATAAGVRPVIRAVGRPSPARAAADFRSDRNAREEAPEDIEGLWYDGYDRYDGYDGYEVRRVRAGVRPRLFGMMAFASACSAYRRTSVPRTRRTSYSYPVEPHVL